MIVEKTITLTLTQQELLTFIARNMRNERGISVDSIQFDFKKDDEGIVRVETIRIFGTDTSEE